MLRERAAPQKAKRAAGMKFDVALGCHPERQRRTSPTKLGSRWRLRMLDCTCVRSLAPLEMTISVIHSIDLPSSLSFMNTNDFSILCVQVPFGARPRFFVPPISGNQIRTALLDYVSPNVCAANMRHPVFIQEDRCGHCRTKSAHCCSVRCPQRMGRFSAGDSGLYSPREGLQTKCIRPVCFIQNRRADSLCAQKSAHRTRVSES